METKTFVHLNPIWRDRANFIIGAWVPSREESPSIRGWEQLWSRQTADDQFEICCIPFFVYNLALGDEVKAATEEARSYVVQHVLKPSGHWTFRALFEGSTYPAVRGEVLKEVQDLGCLVEWYSNNLLGISAPSENQAQAVADLLLRREQLGHLVYETGRI